MRGPREPVTHHPVDSKARQVSWVGSLEEDVLRSSWEHVFSTSGLLLLAEQIALGHGVEEPQSPMLPAHMKLKSLAVPAPDTLTITRPLTWGLVVPCLAFFQCFPIFL